MRAERQAGGGCARGHFGDVAVKGVEVEDGGGGGDVVARARLSDQGERGGNVGSGGEGAEVGVSHSPMNPGSQPSCRVRSSSRSTAVMKPADPENDTSSPPA